MSLEKIADAIKQANAIVGAVIGSQRKLDKGESRTHAVLRSAGTGFAVETGMLAGHALAHHLAKDHAIKAFNLAAANQDLPRAKNVIRALKATRYAGAALGGVAAYNLAKRKKKDD